MATALVARRQAAKVEFRAKLVDAGRAGDTLLPRDVAREQAERREREWAQWEFRCQVAALLRAQGEGWPTVTERETWRLDGGVAVTRHYATWPAALKGVGWWGRLLYGPTGTRRRRI